MMHFHKGAYREYIYIGNDIFNFQISLQEHIFCNGKTFTGPANVSLDNKCFGEIGKPLTIAVPIAFFVGLHGVFSPCTSNLVP